MSLACFGQINEKKFFLQTHWGVNIKMDRLCSVLELLGNINTPPHGNETDTYFGWRLGTCKFHLNIPTSFMEERNSTADRSLPGLGQFCGIKIHYTKGEGEGERRRVKGFLMNRYSNIFLAQGTRKPTSFNIKLYTYMKEFFPLSMVTVVTRFDHLLQLFPVSFSTLFLW